MWLDMVWNVRNRKGLGLTKPAGQGGGLDYILKADRRHKMCLYDILLQDIPSYGSPFLRCFRGKLVISH